MEVEYSEQIKKVKNMHLRYKIECSGVLKDGENKIEIYFHSAIKNTFL